MSENPNLFFIEPDCKQPMLLQDFLRAAAEDPSMWDTFWHRAKRRMEEGGYFHPAPLGADGQPQPDRYLLMLAAQGIRSYKVFEGIEGNEYSVDEMFRHELSDQMLTVVGPPGSGKSKLMDRCMGLVLGQWFYMVDGCRNNCRPEGVLGLLPVEQIKKFPKEFGVTDDLLRLRARNVELCDNCKRKVFGGRGNPNDKPDVSQLKIQPVRLTVSAGHGVAFWTPSESDNNPGIPLVEALKNGTHLCFLKQPFAQNGYNNGGGKVSQFAPLLEAVQGGEIGGHRLPDGTPYYGQVWIENNPKGFKKFKETTDYGAYHRRTRLVPRPFVLSVSRELAIYQQKLTEVFPDGNCAKYDPFVLDAMAALAVFSRVRAKGDLQGNPPTHYTGGSSTPSQVPALKIEHRMRILDGDLTLLDLLFRKHGQSSRPNYMIGTDQNANLSDMLMRLRNAAGWDDGFDGLSEPFMIDEILLPLAVEGKDFPGGRVSFHSAVDFMIRKITEQRKIKDADDSDQQKMYDACITELTLAKLPSGQPSIADIAKLEAKIVEGWFRRLLIHAIERAFFPNLDDTRDARFQLYFNVATAKARGDKTFTNLEGKQSIINDQVEKDILNPVEMTTLGMTVDEAKEYRGRLEARAAMYLRAEAARMGLKVDQLDPSWETLPELKRAVAMLEASDHFAKIDKIIEPEKGKTLDPEDAELLAAAKKRLQAIGYSPESFKEVWKYIFEMKLWRCWNIPTAHECY